MYSSDSFSLSLSFSRSLSRSLSISLSVSLSVSLAILRRVDGRNIKDTQQTEEYKGYDHDVRVVWTSRIDCRKESIPCLSTRDTHYRQMARSWRRHQNQSTNQSPYEEEVNEFWMTNSFPMELLIMTSNEKIPPLDNDWSWSHQESILIGCFFFRKSFLFGVGIIWRKNRRFFNRLFIDQNLREQDLQRSFQNQTNYLSLQKCSNKNILLIVVDINISKFECQFQLNHFHNIQMNWRRGGLLKQ